MSTKARIRYYLQTHKGWVSGLELESKALEWGSKRIGRTLRDMSSGLEPEIDKSYSEDKHRAVRYRLMPKPLEQGELI